MSLTLQPLNNTLDQMLGRDAPAVTPTVSPSPTQLGSIMSAESIK